MSQKERIKVQLKNFFSPTLEDRVAKKDIEESRATPQYRLEASNRNNGRWSCCQGAAGVRELSDIKPNIRLAGFLHWMFRSSFLVLIAVMSITFVALIIAFAGIIVTAGKLDTQCVRVGKMEK